GFFSITNSLSNLPEINVCGLCYMLYESRFGKESWGRSRQCYGDECRYFRRRFGSGTLYGG
ncbi:hypothetical protein KJ032_26700, partial [Salmonella enterica subsp. enterica serovar Typhimurium]|nr:hypothetical protein [Salmonella enterica subsp. enterica serovar Typhimurium]